MKKLFTTLCVATAFLSATASSTPEFINTKKNNIEGCLPRFSTGLKLLQEGKDTVIRVLHIGDSHIQAEFVTNALRKKLQERFGNAGRGVMPALRLAGTNQTTEYTIKQLGNNELRQARLLRYPWPVQPGVTGIAVESNEAMTIAAITHNDPFVEYQVISSKGVIPYKLSNKTDSVTFNIEAGEAFYGINVENGNKGIIYSAIGNNGACYTDYSLIDRFPQTVASFRADLIILSMGTNEGFSIMTDEQIHRSVINLVTSLRNFNPSAEFLILLPMECQKNRNHGHTPLSPYYDINKRVAEAAEIIHNAATELNIPIWDFYSVAGGYGASDKWLEAGLMNKDRIHLVRSGYELQADLLYEALTEHLNN